MSESNNNNANDWRSQLEYSQKGTPLNTMSNGLIVLTNLECIAGKIAYNEHSENTYIVGKVDWDKEYKKPRQFTDYDRINVRFLLENEGIFMGTQLLDDVIYMAAHKNQYNPIKNMLRSLEYKGEGYIRKLLPEYLGVEDNEYNYEVMKLAMLAGVKRIYEPGAKYDYCIVLQGQQGIGKSTFIMKLAMDREWFSDSISALNKGKETAEQIRRKWIIEIGELSAFKKSENESIKSFLSSQQDTYREVYGRYTKDYPRTCIFFGTTNDVVYLHDDTGNRRILPVLTGVNERRKSLFDDKQVNEDFGAAWAEALHIYDEACKNGGSIALVLPEHVGKKALELQSNANEEHSWSGMIKAYLLERIREETNKVFLPNNKVICYTAPIDIWINVLGGNASTIVDSTTRRINNIIRSIKGWNDKGTVRLDGYKGRGFKFEMTKEEAEEYLKSFS